MSIVEMRPMAGGRSITRTQAGDWLDWREPRGLEEGVETPYHHALIEIRMPGEGVSRTINPVDLPDPPEGVVWRPMPWAVEGGQCWRNFDALEPAAVFEGEDGHLFHRINVVCEQILEGGGLSDDGCRRWVDLLTRRLDWCEARNIAYRMLVIPEHHAIYPDKIPGRPSPASDRPIMRIIGAAEPRLREAIIYPLQLMQSCRSLHETSYPHDVHFTRYGAFLCYREVMRSLSLCGAGSIVREDELRFRTVTVVGDVAHAYGSPPRQVEWCDPPPVKFRTVLKGRSFKSNQVDVLESDDTSLPGLLIFRTSNSTHLFPFLVRHFSRLVAVATTRMFFDLAESEAPHVILSEIPERYIASRAARWPGDRDLTSAPSDEDPSTFQEVMGHALPLRRADRT